MIKFNNVNKVTSITIAEIINYNFKHTSLLNLFTVDEKINN